jgi:hypothetical protein
MRAAVGGSLGAPCGLVSEGKHPGKTPNLPTAMLCIGCPPPSRRARLCGGEQHGVRLLLHAPANAPQKCKKFLQFFANAYLLSYKQDTIKHRPRNQNASAGLTLWQQIQVSREAGGSNLTCLKSTEYVVSFDLISTLASFQLKAI